MKHGLAQANKEMSGRNQLRERKPDCNGATRNSNSGSGIEICL